MKLSLIPFCANLLLAQTIPTPRDKCRVEGKVVNSITGAPVMGARVTLRMNPVGGGAAPSGPAATAGAANVGTSRLLYPNISYPENRRAFERPR
jgi:hypothetical protein